MTAVRTDISNTIAIVSFTDNGKKILEDVISIAGEKLLCYNKNTSLKDWIKDVFFTSKAIIFVGAIGIAVRLIAPHIQSKDTDPAVIVIDELGRYVIPILSGHIGGANELANRISNHINATPVITTATDINKKFAIDVWTTKNGMIISDIGKIKYISSAILKGSVVGLSSDFEICKDTPEVYLPRELTLCEDGKLGVLVSLDDSKSPFDITLNAVPKIITLGVGCKRNTDTQKFEEFILSNLKTQSISVKAVKAITSIDLKRDEQCILDFSKKYNIPFFTYSSEQLNQVAGEFDGSEFVKRTTGVDNVCERSAVIYNNDKIVLKKTSRDGMTLSLAMEEWRCKF